MHIAFDYTAGIRQEAGIGHYVRSLLAAMLALDKGNQYTLITSGRPTRERPFPAAPNVRGRGLLIPDRYVNVLWYRWRAPLPAHIFTGQVDIYHGPDFVLPPLSKKIRKVVTIHDLAFLEHPEYAVPSLVEYLKKVVPISLAEADVVAAVSHYSAQTLIEHFQTHYRSRAAWSYGQQVWPEASAGAGRWHIAATQESRGPDQSLSPSAER